MPGGTGAPQTGAVIYIYIYRSLYSICDVGAALFLHIHTDIKTHTSMHACVNTCRYIYIYIYIYIYTYTCIYTGPGPGNRKPPRTQIMGSPSHEARMHLCERGHAHKHTCDLMGDKDGKLSIDSTCTPNCLSHFVAEERPQDKCTPHGQVHFIPHTGNTPGHAQ